MSSLQATVTSRGQITLPKALRELLTLNAGDQVDFTLDSTGRIVMEKPSQAGSSTGCGRQYLNKAQKTISASQMKSAVRQSAARRFQHATQA